MLFLKAFFLLIIVLSSTVYCLKQCTELLPGQFTCLEPRIDPLTQQPQHCSRISGLAETKCTVAPGIVCKGLIDVDGFRFFKKNITCLWTNGYKYETALLLSIFGGVFGLDRFYLGYVALGCLKMWTVGGMGLWYLLDIILLVNNNLHPADRSNLTHPYYNPGIVYLRDSNLL
nr:unnamed protein product [Spirometra erinaceieuropaei]VZI23780.1 unnamed protein product [Spirometra erinaceieuropaei]